MNSMNTAVKQLAIQTKNAFDLYGNRVLYTLVDGVSSETKLKFAEVCKQPEFRPLLQDMLVRFGESLPVPFRVHGASMLELDISIMQNTVLAAFYIRYGLELAMLERRLHGRNELARHLVIAILGFCTAISYLDGMGSEDKNSVVDNLHPWLRGIVSAALKVNPQYISSEELAAIPVSELEKLLQFQVTPAFAGYSDNMIHSAKSGAIQIASDLLSLACPSEQILTKGGDTRLLVEEQTGLNQWAITFSSCTASSISDIAYQEAETLRQVLLAEGFNTGFRPAFAAEMENIRRNISEIFSLESMPGTEIILTSSGTDAELYALHVALGLSDMPVTNIVISSTEIGSGTEFAAGGLHFDEQTPLGWYVVKGGPLEGLNMGRVSVEVVELRHETGSIRNTEGLDRRVKELVSEAAEKGRVSLLHLLDSSKTGVGAPSIDAIMDLKENYGSSLFILTDAAQMRLARESLKRYLENGFMVMITGSKFFTGPPFSGALIIPSELAKSFSRLPSFPVGLAGYATKFDFPPDWERLAVNMSDQTNVGLLLRWKAALWEMAAFYSVEPEDQYRTIKTFGDAILEAIDENPNLELVSAPLHERGAGKTLKWDQLPSIFTFLVLKQAGETGDYQPLTYDEARLAYRCLNLDIAKFLPVTATDREHNLAAKRCHIGQPVRIKKIDGTWIGALRIAAGARLVSGVQFDRALGETPRRRLYTEIHTARALLEKLSVITRYWDELSGYDVGLGVNTRRP